MFAKMSISLALLIASAGRIVDAGIYPNKALTPGSVLTQDAQDVCRNGYTKRVRNLPADKKALVYQRYGVPPTSRDYVIDHFIPLELGGSNEVTNLWPQAWPWYVEKDAVENYLTDEVCQGRMALPVAQEKIAADWRAMYPPPR